MKMEGRHFHAFHSVPRPPTISTFRSLAKGQSSKVINHHPLLHAFRSKHPLTSMNCVRTWPSLYRGIRVRLAMLQGQGHCGKLRPLAFLWRRLQCVDDGGTTHFWTQGLSIMHRKWEELCGTKDLICICVLWDKNTNCISDANKEALDAKERCFFSF